MTHLEYALAYAAIGWHVFPLARGTKKPNGLLATRGHLDATTDTEKITAWWTADPEAGIGVAMQASRLVTVDIDPRNGGHFDLERLEALHGKLEADVLAFTGGGGLHLVFTAPSDIGRLPGKLAKGIDLKADGYIAVEPTFAPLADPPHLKPYAWEASSNPLDGAVPSPLPGWIADLSRAAPTAAGGVDAVMPGRALSDHELADIKVALASIPADERETWLKCGMALHKDVGGALGYEMWTVWSQTCPGKFDAQDQLRVWRSFTRKPMGEAIQIGTVFDLAYKHGFSRPKPVLQLVAQSAAEIVAPPVQTVPEVVHGPSVQLLEMPVQGLNDLTRWVFDSSPSAHGLLAQATALALASTCAGRRYVSEFGDPASVFFGLLTPTTSQARPMLTAAESVLIDIDLRRLVRGQRMSSAQQVYASFVRSSSVLYAADDWGDQMAHAKRQPSGLLSIAHGVLAGRVYSGKDIALDNWAEIGLKKPDGHAGHMPTLYRPALTLLAAIAESQLRAVFKRQEFGRGALDCMLFIPALELGDWTDRTVSEPSALPPAVAARLREMRGLPAGGVETDEPEIDSVLIRPTPITVRFACDLHAAEQRWIEYGRQLPSHLRPLSWGARATMRRLCVAMAAFCDPVVPLVRPEMLVWCERLVRQCLDMTMAEFTLLGDDEDARPDAASKLVEVLTRAGPEGLAANQLHKLCWAYKKLSTDDRQEVLGRLLSDDEITDINTPRGKRYFARQFVVETPVTAKERAI